MGFGRIDASRLFLLAALMSNQTSLLPDPLVVLGSISVCGPTSIFIIHSRSMYVLLHTHACVPSCLTVVCELRLVCANMCRLYSKLRRDLCVGCSFMCWQGITNKRTSQIMSQIISKPTDSPGNCAECFPLGDLGYCTCESEKHVVISRVHV